MVGIAVACACIATGGVILVTHFVRSRQPGQASSGTVTLSQAQTIEQQLGQALTLNNRGNTKGALELYNKVLAEDPVEPGRTGLCRISAMEHRVVRQRGLTRSNRAFGD